MSNARKSANETHRKRLARALAKTEGIGYQAARWRVDAAAREGVLPSKLDSAGMTEALKILRERGRPESRSFEEILAAARSRPVEQRAPGLFADVTTDRQMLLQMVEFLMLGFATATENWEAFDDALADIEALPRADRAMVAYFALGVAYVVSNNYVSSQGGELGPEGEEELLNDVLFSAQDRCSEQIREAFDAALRDSGRPREVAGDPLRDYPAAQHAFFEAGGDESALSFVLEVCDGCAASEDAFRPGQVRTSDGRRVSFAWLWFHINASFAMAVVNEVARRSQRDPMRILDDSLNTRVGDVVPDPEQAEGAVTRSPTRLDSAVRFQGASDAAEILMSGLRHPEEDAPDPFKPVFAEIEADPHPLLRRAGLLFGLQATAFLVAYFLEEPGGPEIGELTQARLNDLAERALEAARDSGAPGPESELDQLMRGDGDEHVFIATAGSQNWRRTAALLATAAAIGLHELSVERDVDPQAVLDMIHDATAPEG